MDVLVAGEALVDFVETPCRDGKGFLPLPGGSPFNVAIGLERLGVPTGFLGRLSRDLFGRMLRSTLETNGVDLRYVKDGDEPSTLAFVVQEENREPSYAFFGSGAADRAIRLDDLPASFPAEPPRHSRRVVLDGLPSDRPDPHRPHGAGEGTAAPLV